MSKLDLKATVSISGLKSVHGENKEYDRALVEIVLDLAGLSLDYRDNVAKLIGIKLED